MIDLTLHRPAALTKELALANTAEHGRRVVISSNFLDAFGFTPASRYDRNLLGVGMSGFQLSTATDGVQQVYRRAYNSRRANPFESQIDLHAQSFLDQALPSWTERVHITIKPGSIAVRPVANHAFHIRKSFRAGNDLSAFVALSSGVDAYCLKSAGFRIAALNEWRPQEKRDNNDLTETGVLTALANVDAGVVFNEDITRLDMATVRGLIGSESPISILHASVQCDDFSKLKSPADKARSIDEGTSSIDMFFDVLRLTETLRPATVLIECVESWATSSACDIVRVRLARWGYDTNVGVFDARDHGGYTSRRRAYLVASLFPGFEFPTPMPRRTTPIWNDFADQIPLCRDVSDSSSVNKGVAVGRDGHLTTSATHAPCLVKSQSHMPKDALYLRTDDGRFLFPTEKMFQRLNEIPDAFKFEATTASLALEQIGQSISYAMHHRLIESIKAHLLLQRGHVGAMVTNRPAKQPPASTRATAPVVGQMDLGLG